MDESSLSGMNVEHPISSSETINTSNNTNISFQKDNKLSDDLKKQIIRSIARNLKEIIKDNILNNQMKFIQKDILYYKNIPSISIEDYIYRIYKNTKMNLSTLIISIIYIDRFCELNSYYISMNNIHNIFLTACLLSLKFNEDKTISSKYYSYVAGIPVFILNNFEFYFCQKLKFSFFVEPNLYQQYFEYFCQIPIKKKGKQ